MRRYTSLIYNNLSYRYNTSFYDITGRSISSTGKNTFFDVISLHVNITLRNGATVVMHPNHTIMFEDAMVEESISGCASSNVDIMPSDKSHPESWLKGTI